MAPYIIFVVLGLKRTVRLPLWLGVLVVLVWFAYSVPLSMWLIVP
jgi:uncharacterized membrane protein YqhA